MRSFQEDRVGVVRSEPLVALGGRDTPEEAFYQVSHWNVGADGAGNLYVLDRSAHRLHVFDPTGRHLRTRGGQGGGPGELRFPFALVVSPDGQAWVVDVGKGALVGWGPDGAVLAEVPLPDGYAGGAIGWTPAGMVFPLRGSDGHRIVVVSGAGEAEVVASLPLAETRAIQLASCGMSFSAMEPIFTPHLTWGAFGGAVVVARNPDYVVEVFDGSRLVRRVERDLPRRPATAEAALRSLGEGMRVGTEAGERICDPGEVVTEQGFAPYLPMVSRVALAPDGSLWVERFGVGTDPRPIDFFAPDGRYVATLPEGSAFPVGFLPDGRVLVSERDELDVERLVVSRIEVGLH